MLRKFLFLAGLIFLGLFFAGAQSGWQRTYSKEALIMAAATHARVIPYEPRRYYIVLTCADAPSLPVYWQRLDNDIYGIRPTKDEVERLKQSAARYASSAGNILANDFVTAGVTGASVSKLIDSRLGGMRRALVASRAAMVLKQRHAVFAGLILAAGSGYYLGDWIFGNWSPRCGSDAAMNVFEGLKEGVENRATLRQYIFKQDSDLTASIREKLARLSGASSAVERMVAGHISKIQPGSTATDMRVELSEAAIEAETAHINEVNRKILSSIDVEMMALGADPRDLDFSRLRDKCGKLTKKIGRRVCTYLQPN